MSDVEVVEAKAWADTSFDRMVDRYWLTKAGVTPQDTLDYEEAGIFSVDEMITLKGARIDASTARKYSEVGVVGVEMMMEFVKARVVPSMITETLKQYPDTSLAEVLAFRKAGVNKGLLAAAKRFGIKELGQVVTLAKTWSATDLTDWLKVGAKLEDITDDGGASFHAPNRMHLILRKLDAEDLIPGAGQYDYGWDKINEKVIAGARDLVASGITDWMKRINELEHWPEDLLPYLPEALGLPKGDQYDRPYQDFKDCWERTHWDPAMIIRAMRSYPGAVKSLEHGLRYRMRGLWQQDMPENFDLEVFISKYQKGMSIANTIAHNFELFVKMVGYSKGYPGYLGVIVRADRVMNDLGVQDPGLFAEWLKSYKTIPKYPTDEERGTFLRKAKVGSDYGVAPDEYKVLLEIGVKPEDMAAVYAEIRASRKVLNTLSSHDDEVEEGDEAAEDGTESNEEGHVVRPEPMW